MHTARAHWGSEAKWLSAWSLRGDLLAEIYVSKAAASHLPRTAYRDMALCAPRSRSMVIFEGAEERT